MVHHEARTLLPSETRLLPNQPNVDFDAVPLINVPNQPTVYFDAVLLIYAILRPVHSLSSPTPIAWVLLYLVPSSISVIPMLAHLPYTLTIAAGIAMATSHHTD